MIDGEPYCRRHAGIVGATPGGARSSSPFPDLENRAPSLVSWVARDIDADVRRMLLTEIGSGDGGQLVADPVALIYVGEERSRAWERSWRAVSQTGLAIRVSLHVAEDDDAVVGVSVGSRLLDRVLPPWILQRRQKEAVPAETDAQRRAEFSRRLLDTISAGIADAQELLVGGADGRH